MAVWGTNFVVIKFALGTLPPLLLATLRFALAFAPAALFVARPAVSWRTLAAYGVLIGAGQFGLLFIALRADITPGLASLVVQTQVFFTIGLAMALAGEREGARQAFEAVLGSMRSTRSSGSLFDESQRALARLQGPGSGESSRR